MNGFHRSLLSLCPVLTVAACSVPNHMHVTEGISPQLVDTNVRFRTTYYFRVFDYCWAADQSIDGKSYRQIVPATDVMYRYRMTGKASALASKIKFESGMLDGAAIDPFGSDAVYKQEIGGFVLRSGDDAKAELADIKQAKNAAAQSRSALDQFETLAGLRESITKRRAEASDPALLTALATQEQQIDAAMVDATKMYLGTVSTRADLDAAIKPLETKIDAIKASVDALSPTAPATVGGKDVAAAAADAVVARLQTIVEQAKVATNSGGSPASGLCPANSILKHGFQLMGPEGMIPYDQNKRLIMAMHTSAEPLIDTLQEYAGRLLKSKPNRAEQLLPLVRESVRVAEAERELERRLANLDGKTPPKVRDITDELVATLVPSSAGPKDATQ